MEKVRQLNNTAVLAFASPDPDKKCALQMLKDAIVLIHQELRDELELANQNNRHEEVKHSDKSLTTTTTTTPEITLVFEASLKGSTTTDFSICPYFVSIYHSREQNSAHATSDNSPNNKDDLLICLAALLYNHALCFHGCYEPCHGQVGEQEQHLAKALKIYKIVHEIMLNQIAMHENSNHSANVVALFLAVATNMAWIYYEMADVSNFFACQSRVRSWIPCLSKLVLSGPTLFQMLINEQDNNPMQYLARCTMHIATYMEGIDAARAA